MKILKIDSTGTIVAWNKCDRMTWKTEDAISQNLSWRIAMSYWRNIKSGLQISLLGNLVSPIDPLFLDKGCEHVESCGSNNVDKLKNFQLGLGHLKLNLKEKKEIIEAEVRMSIFPPRFGAKDVSEIPAGRNQHKTKIMTEFNGILFYRQGRFIDCLDISLMHKKRTFQTYDQNYKIEVNFHHLWMSIWYFNKQTIR